MSKQEVLATKFSEFQDLLNCLAIYNGVAKQKGGKITDFEEALKLR